MCSRGAEVLAAGKRVGLMERAESRTETLSYHIRFYSINLQEKNSQSAQFVLLSDKGEKYIVWKMIWAKCLLLVLNELFQQMISVLKGFKQMIKMY